MPRGEDTRNHPNRGVSRHRFEGGGYVDVMRSPELQRDIDAKRSFVEPDQANPYGMERPEVDED